VIVYSSLFPSAVNPSAGLFIRERMFRVARRMPLVVVAPQAWSPLDGLVRLFRPGFRRLAPFFERMDGVEVHRPRFLSVPGVLKRLDGWLMARSTYGTVARIHRGFGATLIDAHFGYPDGYAATWIGRRLGLPVTITLRGSKDRQLLGTSREAGLRRALAGAAALISVSRSLVEQVGGPLGQPADRFRLVGNGVDLARFAPEDRAEARRRLGIPPDAPVIVGVGNLIELKGFHRVVPLLPWLRRRHPGLVYLVVGGATASGDMSGRIRALAREHGVEDCVRLCGRQPPDELRWFYSAADAFALATEYEGWANVFLEAMACGLPVVTTRVGGNPEVVREPDTGILVDYWDPDAFRDALDRALSAPWDREAIRRYARENDWERRVDQVEAVFAEVVAGRAGPEG
jgi:glycosyltransferase involved in cell wall biosynthesis